MDYKLCYTLTMITFTNQTMQQIIPQLQEELQKHETVRFTVINPDIAEAYAGKKITHDNKEYLYRGYKAWSDLAEILHSRMKTPQIVDSHHVILTFSKLQNHSFHTQNKESEKYGIDSLFADIHKMEEPAFFYYYNQALDNVKIEKRTAVLNLGINRGDEFVIIKEKLDAEKYQTNQFVGVDHSSSAIAYAKQLFPEENVTFYTEDLNKIDSIKLGQFDLLISIGTLQSPSINFKPFLMKLVQEYLADDAAIILGFPNSRWIGGEMLYGAKAPNYVMNEMSLVCNDIMFAKKYLQQKKYRVTITGKNYLFLTATKII